LRQQDLAVKRFGKSSDQDGAARKNRDSEPPILMDEIPTDILVRDLAVVTIPFLDR
jgi:hypothetical protein